MPGVSKRHLAVRGGAGFRFGHWGEHLQLPTEVVGEHPAEGEDLVGPASLREHDVEASMLLRFTEELLLRASAVVDPYDVRRTVRLVRHDDGVLKVVIDGLEEVELNRASSLHRKPPAHEDEAVADVPACGAICAIEPVEARARAPALAPFDETFELGSRRNGTEQVNSKRRSARISITLRPKKAASRRASSWGAGSTAASASLQAAMNSQAPLESWTFPERCSKSRNCEVSATDAKSG